MNHLGILLIWLVDYHCQPMKVRLEMSTKIWATTILLISTCVPLPTSGFTVSWTLGLNIVSLVIESKGVLCNSLYVGT